jgi:hypothetical protein
LLGAATSMALLTELTPSCVRLSLSVVLWGASRAGAWMLGSMRQRAEKVRYAGLDFAVVHDER